MRSRPRWSERPAASSRRLDSPALWFAEQRPRRPGPGNGQPETSSSGVPSVSRMAAQAASTNRTAHDWIHVSSLRTVLAQQAPKPKSARSVVIPKTTSRPPPSSNRLGVSSLLETKAVGTVRFAVSGLHARTRDHQRRVDWQQDAAVALMRSVSETTNTSASTAADLVADGGMHGPT